MIHSTASKTRPDSTKQWHSWTPETARFMSLSKKTVIKVWAEYAWDDYLYWQGQDKKILKRINMLLKDIDRNKHRGIGKPETLSAQSRLYLWK